MTSHNPSKAAYRWKSRTGTDGREYLWLDYRVWREFHGQWWLTGDRTGDDLGPFGTSTKAKAWAERIEHLQAIKK